MSFVELTWQIKPDHRFGLSISPRISYFDLKSLRFQQTEKRLEAEYFRTADDLDTGRPYWMFNLQLNAYILSSTNGRIFFRSNYVFMVSNMKQDFFQAQLGYAFNILRRRPGR